ncbi:MAG: hypothetical protein ACMG6E_08245 [Candidatus Roizmanbacteria bacterium]
MSKHSKQVVDEFFDHAIASWERRKDVEAVVVSIKEEKEGELFEIHTKIKPTHGKAIFIKKMGAPLFHILKQVKVAVKDELARN